MSLVALALILVASYFDVSTRRIPNVATLPAIGLGLVADLARGLGGGFVGVAACLLIESTGRKLGGGDLKLVVAIGSLLGPMGVVVAIAIAAIAFLVLPPRIERPAAPLLIPGVVLYCIGALLC